MNVGFGTPWQEQIDFLRQKLRLPTKKWDDIQRSAHDRAFIVAGAAKADLLADLHQAVVAAAEQGLGQAQFLRQFKEVVARHGWTGWTGEGSAAGQAWRARIIYQTNLAHSYAAGRWQQLKDPDFVRLRPYWRYVHSETVRHPRPQHLAWHGLTLRHDHEFWQTHFAPNGWHCRCRIVAVSRKEGEASAKAGLGQPPKGWDSIDPKTGAPYGIDRGFDYAPGATWHPQLDKYPYDVARQMVADNLQDGVLQRWIEHIDQQVQAEKTLPAYAGLQGEVLSTALRKRLATGERVAIAVLNARGQQALKIAPGGTQTLWLSDDIAIKQILHRSGQDMPLGGYVRMQDILERAVYVSTNGELKLVYYQDAKDIACAVIKVTADRKELYLVSLRRSNQKELDKVIASGKGERWS